MRSAELPTPRGRCLGNRNARTLTSDPQATAGRRTMNVKDAMTEQVISVRPDTSLKDVAAILAEQKIGGLPVVDDQGNVLGVISKADIVLKERAESPYRGWRALFHRREADAVAARIGARTAEEAMMSPAVTVMPSWSVSSAAEL